jgi:aspartyl-tRNA(Asn)/glutamyl-tRNA(Gln) amidotransferase subunit C
MNVTPELVRQVAELARLGLDQAEVELLAQQLDSILGYVEQLKELNTGEVEPVAIAAPLGCPLRPDEERPSVAQEAILSQAPCQEASFFIVPKIIE